MASGAHTSCIERLGYIASGHYPVPQQLSATPRPDPELTTHPNLTLRTP